MSVCTDHKGGREGGGGLTRQFKGIENFLKRVAFNLGNTPSQTEVKIISCIPIDVSDLQQKILCLEKQLDEKFCDANMSNQLVCTCPHTPTCPHLSKPCSKSATICECPAISHTGVFCNILDAERGTNPTECGKCSKHHRGKSNVSFVDSSCPYGFEPHTKKCPYDTRFVQITHNDKNLRKIFAPDARYKSRKGIIRKKMKMYKNKKPRTQHVYYAQTSTGSPFNTSKPAADVPRVNKAPTRLYLAEMLNKQYMSKTLEEHTSEFSNFSSPVCRDVQYDTVNCNHESDICSCCFKSFQNIDNEIIKLNKSFKANPFLTGGYYDSSMYDVVPVKEKPLKTKKCCDMPKKREPRSPVNVKYWPKDGRKKFATRPMYNPCAQYQTMESENYGRTSPKVNKGIVTDKKALKRKIENSKTTPATTKKTCVETITTTDNNGATACARTKTNAECLAKCIINSECQTTSDRPLTEKTEITLNQIKNILQSVLQEVKTTSFTKTIDDITSLDEKLKKDLFGKKDIPQSLLQNTIPNSLPTNMTSSIRDSILGTTVRKNYPDSILENTDILSDRNNIGNPYARSVQNSILTNIPNTRADITNNIASIQTNLAYGCPHNAYSIYSPNPFLPSCSKQVNIGTAFCPASKYIQSCPVYVQTPRPMYANCYHHRTPQNNGYTKQATTTATNTEKVKVERSKETEQLIKEIYKTVALNMGVAHIENVTSNNYKPVQHFSSNAYKSERKDHTKLIPVKEGKQMSSVVQAVSELFRTNNLVSSTTPFTPSDSKPKMTDETNEIYRKERIRNFLGHIKANRLEKEQQQVKRYSWTHRQEPHDSVRAGSGFISSSGTDFDIMVLPQENKQKERKEKKSLLYKMFNTVKMFKPKNKKQDNEKKIEIQDTEETTSNSDDYQTIYSQKVRIVPKQRSQLHKRRTHSKIIHKQVYQRDRSSEKMMRGPYLEQEYRRHWNEKLMFDMNKCCYSSDLPQSGEVPITFISSHNFGSKSSFPNVRTPPKLELVGKRNKCQNAQRPVNGISFIKKRKGYVYGSN